MVWNPWHGCRKLSEGCKYCYVYRMDERHGKNGADVVKNKTMFSLPVQTTRQGQYKVPPGTLLYTCFTSDFFLEDADAWRMDAWRMIRQRSDVTFFIPTKRILRFSDCIPEDWGTGYENVVISCTAENQERADERLPIFLEAPIRHKCIICEPLLQKLSLAGYLGSWIEQVIAGGESGPEARPCRMDWILNLREQCVEAGVPFYFKQTGANFIKDGRRYNVPRRLQHEQAAKAGLNWPKEKEGKIHEWKQAK